VKELPIACTLTPSATAERLEWLRRLGGAALVAGKRDGGRLDLRFDPSAEGEVQAWIRAEQECCRFLSFDLEPGERPLRLTVRGPVGAEPVLEGLLRALRRGVS